MSESPPGKKENLVLGVFRDAALEIQQIVLAGNAGAKDAAPVVLLKRAGERGVDLSALREFIEAPEADSLEQELPSVEGVSWKALFLESLASISKEGSSTPDKSKEKDLSPWARLDKHDPERKGGKN